MTVGKIDNLIPGNAYECSSKILISPWGAEKNKRWNDSDFVLVWWMIEDRLNLLDAVLEPHPYFDSVGHFQTAPDSSKLSDPRADGGSFTFAYSSCIKRKSHIFPLQ
jgi:hypothetical protein